MGHGRITGPAVRAFRRSAGSRLRIFQSARTTYLFGKTGGTCPMLLVSFTGYAHALAGDPSGPHDVERRGVSQELRGSHQDGERNGSDAEPVAIASAGD